MEYTKLDVEKIMTLTPETKEIVVPEGVTEIGEGAFFDAKDTLEKVVLPSSLMKIGKSAFAFCQKLTAVDLPKDLIEIPNSAFSHCSSLKKIEIPAGVKKINSEAFGSAALESIELPSGLEEIGYRAFFKCKLTAIELPQSLKKIESSAFSGNNIESVAFPSGIEKIGGFDCTPLKSVEIPDGVSEIGRFAFASCKNLESVKLPKELIYKEEKYIGWQNKEETRILGGIGDSAFSGCEKLTSIELPENLDMIQSNLFEGCTALKAVKIPASVKQVNREAFKGCAALEEIEIPRTVEKASEKLFCNSGVKKLRWLSNATITENALLDMTSLEEAELNAREIEKFTLCMTYENKDKKDKKCPLKKLIIGKDTEKIEDGAFASLKDLTEIIVDAENKKYAVDSGCLYAKSTKRLIRAISVGEKDGKPLYQISEKVKAIGANAFPKTVENAVVEFLGKIEKVSDKAVDDFSKSAWKKENTPDGATGGARTVYDAMNFVKAKEAKIEAVKKASADALVTVALSDWQYGFDEANGHSPVRKVYRVKLPFDAAFIINMKPKPTQKDAQTVFDTINSLKEITDEEELFEKVRELSAKSGVSVKGSNRELKLIEFSGVSNYEDAANVKSAQGLPPNDFIEKDIASFFAGSSLAWQMSIIADSYSTKEKPYMPRVEIAIKKSGRIVSIAWNHWSIFENAKGNERTELASLISIVKGTENDNLESALKESKFPRSNGVLVFSE
ncbi:MAG: leucine-rich repeat protein [Treponema sp.]|nr:leucine-rich repeat protein [Treponema sp.]